MVTHSRSLAHAQPGLDLRPAFRTPGHPVSLSACPRPGPILHLRLLVHRPYVSISSPLQSGIGFLGHPTPPRLTAWSPPPALPERALGGFPRSTCPFSVVLGRYSTPGLLGWTPRRVYTWHLEPIPFWACLSAVWQVSIHDAYVPSSKILSITTCLGRHRFRLAVYPLPTLALRRLMTSLPP
jgi:hypothetical protein